MNAQRSVIVVGCLVMLVCQVTPGDEDRTEDYFPTDSTYHASFQRIEFQENELRHVDPRLPEGEVTRTYTWKPLIRGGVPFLQVSREDEQKQWLILASDRLLLLYDGESPYPFFVGVSGHPNAREALYSFPDAFTATSSLAENDTTYVATNLGEAALRTPWVEAAEGQGVGEEIRIAKGFPRLWISVGFVSYSRPELYELNSRPKRIRVVDDHTGAEKTVRLEDTPSPQSVTLPGDPSWEHSTIRLIIEEVYPGTRWEDTCVNFILFF
ncbi:MAG: NADase-type glycan-binding domain-containing protein [Spirochaetaceae bacterium]